MVQGHLLSSTAKGVLFIHFLRKKFFIEFNHNVVAINSYREYYKKLFSKQGSAVKTEQYFPQAKKLHLIVLALNNRTAQLPSYLPIPATRVGSTLPWENIFVVVEISIQVMDSTKI